MTGFQPPDWKKLAQKRIKEKLAPILHDLKRVIQVLESSRINNPLINAGIADYWFSAIHKAIEVEKRYTVQRYIDAIVTECGLRDLVNVEEIKKFEWPE